MIKKDTKSQVLKEKWEEDIAGWLLWVFTEQPDPKEAYPKLINYIRSLLTQQKSEMVKWAKERKLGASEIYLGWNEDVGYNTALDDVIEQLKK
jgi:hypothetical protein